MSGHELAREILVKHGRDRYPTTRASLLKLTEEVGELAGAFIDSDAWDADQGQWRDHLRKEYGDVGIALYLLGDKLGLDLETEMREVVEKETRRFA